MYLPLCMYILNIWLRARYVLYLKLWENLAGSFSPSASTCRPTFLSQWKIFFLIYITIFVMWQKYGISGGSGGSWTRFNVPPREDYLTGWDFLCTVYIGHSKDGFSVFRHYTASGGHGHTGQTNWSVKGFIKVGTQYNIGHVHEYLGDMNLRESPRPPRLLHCKQS